MIVNFQEGRLTAVSRTLLYILHVPNVHYFDTTTCACTCTCTYTSCHVTHDVFSTLRFPKVDLYTKMVKHTHIHTVTHTHCDTHTHTHTHTHVHTHTHMYIES